MLGIRIPKSLLNGLCLFVIALVMEFQPVALHKVLRHARPTPTSLPPFVGGARRGG